MDTASRTRVEELLAHREWVGRVARALVGERGGADDLEQDLWVSVLENPPAATPRSPRAWLARALRFKAVDRWRSDARRRRREEEAARPELVPAADDAVARGELLRRVVQAVMDLDEPYRSTVLLRYVDGLSPAEVAARQGVPRETVHTRLGRALVKLRERLDAEHGGERRAWLALLAPLAGGGGAGRPRALPRGTAGTAATVAVGGMVMGAKAKAAVVAVALLALGAGWWFLDERGDRTPSATQEVSAQPRVRRRTHPVDADAADARGDAHASAGSAATPVLPEEAPGRPRGVLRGLVVGPDGATPVAGAPVEIRPFGGVVPDGMTPPVVPLRERAARSGADGRFVVEGVPIGAWTLAAAHPDHGRAERDGVAGSDPPWVVLRLEVARERLPLRLRLVDEEGSPVAGATVQATKALDRPFASVVSDAEGRALLEGFDRGSSLVVAAKDGVAAQIFVAEHYQRDRLWVQATRDADSLEAFPDDEVPLTLRATGTLAGRVSAPDGAAVAGAVVEAWVFTNPQLGWHNGGMHREASVGADSTYRLEVLTAGSYVLLVRHPRGLRVPSRVASDDTSWGKGPPRLELPRVVVAAGQETTHDLALEYGGTIRGRVVRTDGSPVAGARVELHLPLGNGDNEEHVRRGGVPLWRLDADRIPDERRHPATSMVAATGADGTYEMRGLVPAVTWRVRVVPPPDLSFDLQQSVAVDVGTATELRHVVEPAGTLEALLPPFSSLGLRRVGEPHVRASFITAHGSGAARIPGLPAGEWELLSVRDTTQEALRPPVTFLIAAGQTTVLDAPGAGLPRVTARFVDDGKPVAGVRVTSLYSRGSRFSDVDGVVVLREWAGRNAFGRATETATTNLTFQAPGPGATLLRGSYVPVEPVGPIDEWNATVEVPSARVVFRARQIDGRPWAGVSVRLESAPAPGRRFRDDAAWGADLAMPRRTGDDGSVTFATLPAGHYRWFAELPDGALRQGTVSLADPETKEVVLAGEVTAAPRVTVLTADGRPAPGATVHVRVLRAETDPGPDSPDRWDSPTEGVAGKPATGADGVVLVRGLVRGVAHVFALRKHGDPRGGSRPCSETVELNVNPPAEVPVTLHLPPER